MVVFSAATALMGSNDVQLRVEALRNAAKKNNISDMALVELFHKFHSDEEDQNDMEGEALKEVLEDPGVEAEIRALFIRGITEIGYYNLVEYLLERLEAPPEGWEDPEVIKEIIRAQGAFNNVKSIDVIRKYLDHDSPEVVAAAIDELSDYGSEDDIDTFRKLLFHSSNNVKRSAVYALLQNNIKETEVVYAVPEEQTEQITKYVMMYMNEQHDEKLL
jgi:HEAT repeat protein